MKIDHSKTSQLLNIHESDSEEIKEISQLFRVCAGMDEVSGSSEDFTDLLKGTQEDALEDDDLSFAAGGIKPITPPKR